MHMILIYVPCLLDSSSDQESHFADAGSPITLTICVLDKQSSFMVLSASTVNYEDE